MDKLIVLELNEVNFEFIEKYIQLGKLPVFKGLFERYGYAQTTSEDDYDKLEPWIQWVTAHSGKSLAEHGVFRLGDIDKVDVQQIWEYLEQHAGATVAAVSPMNALNKTNNSPFFVPDPWTGGRISGPENLKGLYNAVAQAVNQNATGEMGASVLRDLAIGLVRHGRFKSLAQYASYIAGFPAGKWRKALVLDRLLADLFISNWRRSRPDFATLFVNAAAHIQHHYMFSSQAYDGDARNPSWYVSDSADPVLEAYALYDRLVGEILQERGVRVMIMTGLHQDPHSSVTYYYRLRQHDQFLRRIGMRFDAVEPRMSRDFLVRFTTEADALEGERLLLSAKAENGQSLFFVENRGRDIFAMLTYPNAIDVGFGISVDDKVYPSFDKDVAFVAIKNGEHNGIGYFVDTGWKTRQSGKCFELKETFTKISDAFSVDAIRKSAA